MRKIKSALVGLALILGFGCGGPMTGLGESIITAPSSLDDALRATAAIVDTEREGRVFCAGVFVNDMVITAAHCTTDRDGNDLNQISVSVYGEADETGNHFPHSWVYNVKARDHSWDIAVLGDGTAPHQNLQISLGGLHRGQHVAAIGHPYGLSFTLTDGLVSAPLRVEPDGLQWVQVSAPVAPGNSGGPLLNMDGEVVGICSIRVGGEAHLGGFVPPSRVRAIMARATLHQ